MTADKEQIQELLHGVFAALITPYDSRGEVDYQVLQDLIDFQLGEGLHGFFVTGGTGEGLVLDLEERKAIAETVVSHVGGRACVIAHVGALSTRQMVQLARHSEQAGADVVAAIPPVYYKPNRGALLRYYAALAESIDLPWIVYHIPSVTSIGFTHDVVRELLRFPNFAGLKFTDYNLFQMQHLLEAGEGRIRILSGADEVLLPALTMGAHGCVGTTQNLLPRQFVRIYEAYRSGDLQTAQTTQRAINRVIRVLLPYGLAGFKAALGERGFPCGKPREPISGITEEQHETLRGELDAAGFRDLLAMV